MNVRATTKLATVLAAVALAVVGIGAPSQAGGGKSSSWTGVDPAKDVAAYTCKPGPCHWKKAPGDASADMVRQVVTYRHDTIKIAVTMRKIDRSSAFSLTSILKKTELSGRYYGVIASYSPDKGTAVVIRNPHGTPVDCGAARPRFSGNKIKVSVPARCLNAPDWVRWSGYTRVIFKGDLDDDAQYEGYFDKFRTGSQVPLNKNTYEFSRRVYRAA